MGDESFELAKLLRNVLCLTLNLEGEVAIEDQLKDILVNSSCNQEDFGKDSFHCDIRTYVDTELATRFQLTNTDSNFNIGAERSWSELLDGRWRSAEYAVALQIVISLSSLSAWNRQKLGEIRGVKDLLFKRVTGLECSCSTVQEKLADLCGLVMGVNCSPRDMVELYTHFPAASVYRTLESLAAQMSDPAAQAYLQFENCYKTFEVSQPAELRYTIQFFIQFSNVTSVRLMTVGRNVYLEIKEGQFCVSNDEFIIALFDELELEAEKIYCIAVTISGDDVSLFMDGNLVGTITLFDACITSIDRFDLGSMICSFRLYRLVMYGDVLSEKSLKLISCMGSSFRSTFEKILDTHAFRSTLGDSFIEKCCTDASFVENWLGELEGKNKTSILVDVDPSDLCPGDSCMHENSKALGEMETLGDSSNYLAVGKCFHYKPACLLAIFQSVDCFRYLLCNLENACDMDELFRYLSHLMTLLHNSYMRALYKKDYGYSLLSHILATRVRRKLRSPLPIQFFNLFEEFCGWNFTNISKSLIEDETAYQSLVLNIDLWYDNSSETDFNQGGVEIIRFLLFQIANLLESSELKSLNSQKLQTLNVWKTFCYTQHIFAEKYGYPNMFDEMTDEITSLCRLFLNNDFSRANIHWHLQYSYSELKSGLYPNSEVILSALDSFFAEALDGAETKKVKCMTDSISCKFLVMTLDEVVLAKRSPMTVLNLLLKVLLINQAAYKNFTRSNGFDLLFEVLKEADACYYEEIVYLLYGYSLGDYGTKVNFETLEEFESGIVNPNSTMVLKELILLSVQLLEWAVINDITDAFQIDLDRFLSKMVEKISSVLESYFNVLRLDNFVLSLFSALLDLLITLTKPQNSLIYERSANMVRRLLADNVTKAMISLKAAEFERYLEAMISPLHREKDTISVDEEEFDLFELAYMRIIVPAIFEDLKEMMDLFTEKLFESDCMLLNFLHFFNRFKRLLGISKLKSSVYVNMMQCILVCIKGAEESGGKKNRVKSLCEAFSFSALALLLPTIATNERTKKDDLEQCVKFFTDYGDDMLKVDFEHYNDDLACFMCWCLLQLIITSGFNIKISALLQSLLRSNETGLAHAAIQRDELSYVISLIQFPSEQNSDRIKHFIRSLESSLKIGADGIAIRKFGTKEPSNSFHDIQLTDVIFAHRESKMDSRVRDLQKKLTLFRSDNTPLDRNLRISFKKHYTNYIIDREEEFLVHEQNYNDLAMQLEYSLGLQLGNTGRCIWGIDSVQGLDGIKGRLVPFIPATTTKVQLGYGQQNVENEDLGLYSAQPKATNGSLLSYDFMSEMDTLEVLTGFKEDENRKILKILKGHDRIRKMWNCSLVIGLDVREGVLICGEENMYFVGNYHYAKGENRVLRLSEAPESERDANINLISGSESKRQQCFGGDGVQIWSLPELASVIKRPFLLRDAAMELVFENGTSYFLSFNNKSRRDDVYYVLDKLPKNQNIDPVLYSTLLELNKSSGTIGLNNGIYKTNLRTKFVKAFASGLSISEKFSATAKWQRGELSNFYYLMTINTLAGRTFNDITQYPVFPWVIADYTSEELDLNNPLTFRDLSKPMGAQSQIRRAQFIERYEALESLNDPDSHPFHYGTHYSSAMIVSSYLIRLKPYVDSFLLLQGGSFGHADRLFNSIGRAWSSAAIENTTDVRELIPEFFFLPDFLVNSNNIDFGKDQQGHRVSDVALPPWAKNDPKIFIAKNREALESPYVSRHLHLWIDLVFGWKQRGENAKLAVNVFNNLSYPGAVNLDSISDENERRAITGIIHNFGQTPLQIFQENHPPKLVFHSRKIIQEIWEQMVARPRHIYLPSNQDAHEIAIRYIFWEVFSDGTVRWRGYPFLDVMISGTSQLLPLKLVGKSSLQIGTECYEFLHSSRITGFSFWKQQEFITGDANGIIKVWKFQKTKDTEVLLLHCMGTLYGHLSEIKDIKIFHDYNSLLSLDREGTVYLWDLIDNRILRRISSVALQAAISQNKGTVAVYTMDKILEAYNFSGMLYARRRLDPNMTVTSIDFFNFSSIDLGSKRHAYWQEKELIVVGYDNGILQVYQLVLDNEWQLRFVKQLNTGKGFRITAIRTQLRIQNKDDATSENMLGVPKLEIMAGDTRGFLYLWK